MLRGCRIRSLSIGAHGSTRPRGRRPAVPVAWPLAWAICSPCSTSAPLPAQLVADVCLVGVRHPSILSHALCCVRAPPGIHRHGYVFFEHAACVVERDAQVCGCGEKHAS